MVSDRKPQNHWLRDAVIVLIALIIAGFVYHQSLPEKPQYPAGGAANSPSNSYNAGGHRCKPEALTKLPDTPAGRNQRDRCAEANEQARREDQGLHYSAKSVDAALAANMLTYREGLIEAAGTAIGFLTFLAAAAAALYARRAADETERAADTADDALEHGRIATRAAQRPYIYVDRIEQTLYNGAGRVVVVPRFGDPMGIVDNADIVIVLKNVGQTPARNVRYNFGGDWETESEPRLNPEAGPDSASYDLPPGGEYRQVTGNRGLSRSFERLGTPTSTKREHYFHWLKVSYSDEFGSYGDTFYFALRRYGSLLWQQVPFRH